MINAQRLAEPEAVALLRFWVDSRGAQSVPEWRDDVALMPLEAVPNVYASPVGAAGRVYVTGREGTVAVLAAGPKLELLATNKLEDGFDASPALVDREIYLRGRKHLYRISAD